MSSSIFFFLPEGFPSLCSAAEKAYGVEFECGLWDQADWFLILILPLSRSVYLCLSVEWA